MDPREVITYWLLCFVSIFGVVNPIRAASVFALSSASWTAPQRASAAARAVLIAGAILFLAGWIGNHILLHSGIHLGGFRIASGLLLLATVIPAMVRNEPFTAWTHPPTDPASPEPRERALSPLAIPLLCSAGSIATVTLYSGEVNELWRRIVILTATFVTLGIAYVLLRFSDRMHALVGELGARVMTQVLNISVAAWAVDFTAIGVRDLLPLVLSTPPAGG